MRSFASLFVAVCAATVRADYVQIAQWLGGDCTGAPFSNDTGTCCCQQVVTPTPPYDTYFVNVTCLPARNVKIDLFTGYCAGTPVASTTTQLPASCAPFHPFDDNAGGVSAEQNCVRGSPPSSLAGGATGGLMVGAFGAALREAMDKAAASR